MSARPQHLKIAARSNYNLVGRASNLRSNLSADVGLRYEFKGTLESFDTVAQTRDAKAYSAARVLVIAIDKSRTAIAHRDDDRLCISANLDALP